MKNYKSPLCMIALALVAASSAYAAEAVPNFGTMPQGEVDGKPKPSAAEIMNKVAPPTTFNDANSKVSDAKLAEFDRLIDAGDYVNLAAALDRLPRDPKVLEWSLSRSNQGNVFLMWDLAERYATTNSIELAVKWTNTALIGLLQERQLCTDRMVDSATGAFVALHPRLQKLTRANSFSLAESKLFAMGVLANAHHYPSPEPWLCKPFTSPESLKKNKNGVFSYAPENFDSIRAQARNKLRIQLQIPQNPEPVPPLGKP